MHRRTFLLGLGAATLPQFLRAAPARPPQRPAELIFHTQTGRLGLVGLDGTGHRILRFDQVPAQQSWGVGPRFADGRRVLLHSFGEGAI